MDHRLVQQIEKALGWSGPQPLGAKFGIGRMPDPSLCDRLLNPRKLLSLVLRRSLTHPQLRCLKHGKDLHPTAYLTATTTGRGQRIEVADMRRLGWLLREGATLVLDDVGPLDATLPALRPLLSGQPASIHEITTATGINAATLADTLIAEGICAEVTPDLAEGYAGMLTPHQHEHHRPGRQCWWDSTHWTSTCSERAGR
jgi:hypothetical protein